MNETLGSVVSVQRQKLGMTQRELARKVGISNSTVSRIESNDGITPDTATLKAIADALHIDYNYLLALSGQIDDEPEVRVIQRAAKKMKAEDREKMLNVLKTVFTEYDFTESDIPGEGSDDSGGK